MKSIVEEASSIAKAVEKGWIRAGKPREFSVKIFEEAERNFLGMTSKPAKVALFFKEAVTTTHTDNRSSRQPSEQRQKRTDRSTRTQRTEHHDRPPRKEKHDSSDKPGHIRSPYIKNTAAQNTQKPRNDKFERQEQDKRAGQSKGAVPNNRQDYTEQKAPSTPTIANKSLSKDSSQADDKKTEKPKRTAWAPEMVEIANSWMKGTLKTINAQDATFSSKVSGNSLRYTFSTSITGDEDRERLLFSSFANLILATLRSKYKREFRHLKVILNTQ